MLGSRSGPEATVDGVADQVGPRLTEIRQYYDSLNEFVRTGVVSHVGANDALPPRVSGAIIGRD